VVPVAITRWAGHSSSAFVLDRYGHLLDGPAATATARLDQMARAATATVEGGARLVGRAGIEPATAA
jgi:hypothetical protein